MTRSRPTVGIIGTGYGRAHIPAFRSQGCEVVALCQRQAARAEAVAARYGVPRVLDRWEALLEAVRPDIVVIATPPHLHHVIAVEALASGCHVLCEKPLAMSAAEARAMAEAARRAGRVAMTSFNWRFVPAMRRLHALVQAGAIGRPLHISAHWMGARWAAESAPATWRMDRAQAGLGAMGDMGVHVVDLVRAGFGEWTRVTAQAGIAYPGRRAPGADRPADAEDYCAVLGELDSGVQASFTVSRAAHGMNEHGLTAFGTEGALRYRVDRDRPAWYRAELSHARSGGRFEPVRVPTGLPRSAGEGDAMEVVGKATIAPLVKLLLRGIRRGETPSPSFDDGAAAQAVLDAVAASLAGGGWVSVGQRQGPQPGPCPTAKA